MVTFWTCAGESGTTLKERRDMNIQEISFKKNKYEEVTEAIFDMSAVRFF